MIRKSPRKEPRKYMEMAYEEMLKSVHDNDSDKISPYVAALVVLPDGSYDIAHRCHTRDGHHAEESVLDDMNHDISFDGAELYVTLEPCIPSSRSADKTACSVRIVDARIKKVYVGMRDPNPEIYNRGIQYLLDNGIAVQMFDEDIRKKIEEANHQFIEQFGQNNQNIYREIETNILPSLSEEAIQYYCKHSGIDISNGYGKFWDKLIDFNILAQNNKSFSLSNDGYLAFAKDTRKYCDSAVMQLLVRFSPNTLFNPTGKSFELREDYYGPQILIIEKVQKWAEKYLPQEQDRTEKNTEIKFIVPFPRLKEAVVNAVVHRDYTEDTGAFTQLFISDSYLRISNPTKLSNTTLENLNAFKSQSNPINPRFARLFQEAHLMERSGSGMQTFSEAVPRPFYDYEDGILSLKFGYSGQNALLMLQSDYNVSLSQIDYDVFEFIRSKGTATRKEIEERFTIPTSTASYRIKRLVSLNMVQRIGPAKSRHITYSIVPPPGK